MSVLDCCHFQGGVSVIWAPTQETVSADAIVTNATLVETVSRHDGRIKGIYQWFPTLYATAREAERDMLRHASRVDATGTCHVNISTGPYALGQVHSDVHGSTVGSSPFRAYDVTSVGSDRQAFCLHWEPSWEIVDLEEVDSFKDVRTVQDLLSTSRAKGRNAIVTCVQKTTSDAHIGLVQWLPTCIRSMRDFETCVRNNGLRPSHLPWNKLPRLYRQYMVCLVDLDCAEDGQTPPCSVKLSRPRGLYQDFPALVDDASNLVHTDAREQQLADLRRWFQRKLEARCSDSSAHSTAAVLPNRVAHLGRAACVDTLKRWLHGMLSGSKAVPGAAYDCVVKIQAGLRYQYRKRSPSTKTKLWFALCNTALASSRSDERLGVAGPLSSAFSYRYTLELVYSIHAQTRGTSAPRRSTTGEGGGANDEEPTETTLVDVIRNHPDATTRRKFRQAVAIVHSLFRPGLALLSYENFECWCQLLKHSLPFLETLCTSRTLRLQSLGECLRFVRNSRGESATSREDVHSPVQRIVHAFAGRIRCTPESSLRAAKTSLASSLQAHVNGSCERSPTPFSNTSSALSLTSSREHLHAYGLYYAQFMPFLVCMHVPRARVVRTRDVLDAVGVPVSCMAKHISSSHREYIPRLVSHVPAGDVARTTLVSFSSGLETLTHHAVSTRFDPREYWNPAPERAMVNMRHLKELAGLWVGKGRDSPSLEMSTKRPRPVECYRRESGAGGGGTGDTGGTLECVKKHCVQRV